MTDAFDGPEVDRRRVLGALAATGGVPGLPDDLPALLEEGATAVDDATADPHTEATFRAFAEAVIPATPDLAARRGEEHEFGAGAVGVWEFLVWFLNRALEPGLYRLLEEPVPVRLAEGVAAFLDAGATALLARGDNEAEPDPARYPGGGPFASLAPADRFRAVTAAESLPPEDLPAPFDALDHKTGYVVQAIHLVAMAGYYTEWAGYGGTRTADPSEREYTGSVPSREQTKYPGPIDGAAAHRGYEVRRFREDDYPTEGDGEGGGGPGSSGGDDGGDGE